MVDFRKHDRRGKSGLTNEEIAYSLDAIIASCEAIIRRVSGIDREEFLSNDDMMKATGMDMIIIGNHANELPAEIKSRSRNLGQAYGFRCRVAHDYGSMAFEEEYLWVAATVDVHDILDACLEAKRDLAEGRIGFLSTRSRRRKVGIR